MLYITTEELHKLLILRPSKIEEEKRRKEEELERIQKIWDNEFHMRLFRSVIKEIEREDNINA